jgi:hypothetical protein
MALNITKILDNGVSVPFWIAKLNSLNIQVNYLSNDLLEILVSIRIDGYLSSVAYTSGSFTPIGSITINDFTQDECADILKKSNRPNIKKEIYKIIKKRTGWETATQSTEDET